MRTLISFLAFCFPLIAIANQADTQQAMSEVQKQLRDPHQRQKMIDSPKAKKAADYATQVSGGGENENEMYDIAADIFGNMKNMSAEEMSALLEKAQKNPEGFIKSLTPEQQQRIKELAAKTPAANQKRP